jgi:hypothetical protein
VGDKILFGLFNGQSDRFCSLSQSCTHGRGTVVQLILALISLSEFLA